MRARDHVGELRPSQLLHTYGVGATVELPEMTTIVLGLDDWPARLCEPVSEPRLLAAARSVSGEQVERLLTPPVVPDGDAAGVPVAPFPRWLRCPLCSLLAPIENKLFAFKPDAWRPERTTYVHEGCPKSHSRRPPTAFPARYMMVCEDGHLDDFPWVEFLHGGVPCSGTLRLVELGSGGRAGDVQLSCDACGRRRRLSQAFGEDARPYLPPRCRGRHPHLGLRDADCSQEPQTLLLGASNAWFPVQLSALSIPSREGEVAQAVEEAWAALESLPAGALAYALQQVSGLAKLTALADQTGLAAIEAAIEARRGQTGDGDPRDLRTPEWRVLCDPTQAPESAGLQAARRRAAARLRRAARRRRPGRATAGGERAAGVHAAGRARRPRGRAAGASCGWRARRRAGCRARGARRGALLPLPGGRDRGVGGALPLKRGSRPAARRPPGVAPAARPPRRRGLPTERYLVLHASAHALIRELALECGYTASSIRERLYAADGRDGEPMAGVLLYTVGSRQRGDARRARQPR